MMNKNYSHNYNIDLKRLQATDYQIKNCLMALINNI